MRLILTLAVFVFSAGAACAAAFTVTTNADSGPGSLREIIDRAHSDAGHPTIEFRLPPGQTSICPTSPLPQIKRAMTIDGWSQPGWTEAPPIELDGSCLAGAGNGLVIRASGTQVRGLIVNGWPDAGIHIEGCDDIVLTGLYVGTSPAGDRAKPNGHTPSAKLQETGILVIDSDNNRFGGPSPQARMVLSGNAGYGMSFMENVNFSRVLNSFIGTNATGTAAVPNSATGLRIQNSAHNQIGGTDPSHRVVASGNSQYGIMFVGPEAVGNSVKGSHVGVDYEGTEAVPNGRTGVLIFNAPENLIGGNTPAARNVISGNARAGVNIDGSSFGNPPPDWSGTGHARDNLIEGNYIGLDASGTTALANGLTGVRIFKSQSNRIVNNVISGNAEDGIILQSDPERDDYHEIARGNRIEGNRIGTNAAGTEAIPNGRHGVFVMGNSNTIGSSRVTSGNLIKWGLGWGLQFRGPDAATNENSEHNIISDNVGGQFRLQR